MQRGYPLSLNLLNRACLVVGSGVEAPLRTRSLLEAGARVTVVGQPLSDALLQLAAEPRLKLEQRAFQDSDLEGVWLVVQADQNTELASRLGQLCEARGTFFCAIDQPEHSSYAHMALARAGSLTFAIGTEGRAPALGRRLREELTRLLEESHAAEQVERLAALRESTPAAERRQVLSAAVQGVHFTGKLRFEED